MTDTSPLSLDIISQISARGQVTLPASIRKKLSLKGGDPVIISIVDGQIVLRPAVVSPIEYYTDERVAEFERENTMPPDDISDARKHWGLTDDK
mgnify:CR=1 FL=1